MTTRLPDPVRSAALARPTHVALVDLDAPPGHRTLTWAELDAAVDRAAAALLSSGVGDGDRVALDAPPSAEWIVAFHAIARAAAVPCPLRPGLPAAARTAALEALAPARILSLADFDAGSIPPDAPDIDEPWWPIDAPRLVVMSSGTTGAPRPIELTAGQLVFSAMGSTLRLGHALDDRWLLCLPPHHVGGASILLRAAWAATSVVLHRQFDPSRVARALDGGEVSLVSLVPEMLARVLDARPTQPFSPKLRAILLGGDAAPEALLARGREIGAPIAVTWGMSETASQATTRFAGDLDRPAGDAGPPLAFARVDADGGRLVVRGPIAAAGVQTRDRGTFDDGRVRILGRADDTIVTGGENVDPAAVEMTLLTHPGVAEAAVAAVADPRWGQRPAAWLVAAQPPSPRPDRTSLEAWCRARLPGFAVPAHFTWCDSLPRTALGKLRRSALGLLGEQA